MRRSSLRTWLLAVSIAFALVTVGGISVSTYVVVSDGMSAVAQDTAKRLATLAAARSRDEVGPALEAARESTLTTGVPASDLDTIFSKLLRDGLNPGGASAAQYAYYDADGTLIWSTSPDALLPAQSAERDAAIVAGSTQMSSIGRGPVIYGLFAPAKIGIEAAHVPVTTAAGVKTVLDVVYVPLREERVINEIRLPMTTLAITAFILMVVMMQTSMTWILRLVDNLRQAADSVDAGDLGFRLPEQGDNEIGDLARSINRLIDRLRRRSDAQSRFVADASHELATPVAGIRGYTNILLGWGADDPELRDEAVSAIDRESKRMARLTSELLTLVRSEQALEVRAVRFDLNMSAREVLAVTATRYQQKGQSFIGPDEGPLVMTSDPDRVEDVLSILLDNAAKYTPEAGRISVVTRRKRESVYIEVGDTGTGIPRDDLPNIFERFYRSDASRSRGTGGFGLGLAIAKSITEELDGSLSVESSLGLGTTFTLKLPRGRV
jgi:signal transduction histidine kinase